MPLLEDITEDISIGKPFLLDRLGNFSISRIFKLAEMSEQKRSGQMAPFKQRAE